MLDSNAWSEYKGQPYERECNIRLPKFNIETRFDLIPYLRYMGVNDAFDDSKADFSLMTSKEIFIGIVNQVTNIMVDEKGTEAAAVTIVGGFDAAAPGVKTIDFFVDRPFAFIIDEQSTGAILFMGRVNRL